MRPRPPRSTLFPYTTLFRSNLQDKMDRVFKTLRGEATLNEWHIGNALKEIRVALLEADVHFKTVKEFTNRVRSEEHTSELQSQSNLVCRLLLEKKKQTSSAT